MKVGFIGCGTWGSRIREVVEDLGHRTLVSDPAIEDSLTVDDLLELSDRIVIATPPKHHAEYALMAVEWEKPFFVEKPLALQPSDAAFIKLTADMVGIPGAVGHIARHAPGFPHKENTDVWSVRAGRNPGYHGVSAWWDLGVHDVAVCVLLNGRPTDVKVTQSFDAYHAHLRWGAACSADLWGDRDADDKEWRFVIGGRPWSPYSSGPEPLKTEMEWWLAGGTNLDEGVVVVETLFRGDS